MFAGMTFKDWFSVFTSVVGVFVIPFTLVGIWRSRVVSQQADNWKARQEEIGTYNDINTRYAEFLRMLLANPDVDIGEFETPRKLATRTERYKRNLMYAVLVSIMERAYLLYTAIDRFEKGAIKSGPDGPGETAGQRRKISIWPASKAIRDAYIQIAVARLAPLFSVLLQPRSVSRILDGDRSGRSAGCSHAME